MSDPLNQKTWEDEDAREVDNRLIDGSLTPLSKDPIVESVVAKLRARSEFGRVKYGMTLSQTPAEIRDRINHLQQELMDGANYCEWLLEKLDEIDAALARQHFSK